MTNFVDGVDDLAPLGGYVNCIHKEALDGLTATDRYNIIMMSSNENFLCVTGSLCGEFTGRRRIDVEYIVE